MAQAIPKTCFGERMTKKAIMALLIVLGLTSTTIVLAETQQTEYVLELQGPTWDHSTINLIVTTRYNETWWDPAYLKISNSAFFGVRGVK